jgi:hypothetical protein
MQLSESSRQSSSFDSIPTTFPTRPLRPAIRCRVTPIQAQLRNWGCSAFAARRIWQISQEQIPSSFVAKSLSGSSPAGIRDNRDSHGPGVKFAAPALPQRHGIRVHRPGRSAQRVETIRSHDKVHVKPHIIRASLQWKLLLRAGGARVALCGVGRHWRPI